MSGLLESIGVQAQSLNAQSAAISVAGKNLSNSDDPNYAVETANLASTTDGGAMLTGVTDARSQIIDAQIAQSLSAQGSLNAQQNTASTIQSLLGEQINTAADSSTATGNTTSSSSESGLSTALSNFFNSFSQLSSDPSQTSYQQAAISSAQTLAGQLNGLSSSLSQESTSVGQEVNAETTQAQGLLQSIASLNGQIAKLEISNPGSALDLINSRQGDINTLSGLMNITVTNSPEGLGQVDIGSVDAGANPVPLVSDATVQGSLSYNSGTNSFTGGLGGTTLDITGGTMAGYQSMVGSTIPTLNTNLNNIANQLVTSVNAVYSTGATGSAGNFFAPAGTTAATIAVQPAIVSAGTLVTGTSGTSGDNSDALAIANLQTHSFASGGGNTIQGTFGNYYNSNVVTAVGQQVSSLSTQQDTATLVYNNLMTQQQSVEGVSTDQQTSDLMIYQRAYQGIANVITVMNTLLNTVVTGLGIG